MVAVSKELYWIGPLVGIIIVAAQIAWVSHKDPRLNLAELARFAGLLLLVSVTCDTLMMHFGFFKFASNPLHNITSPPWMMVLMIAFAVTFYISGRRLFTRYWQVGVASLIGGSLFYAALGEFSALFLYDKLLDTLLIGVLWAFLLPLCLYVNDFFAHH